MPNPNKEAGQSTVEFALVAPLVAICAGVLVAITFACVQVIQLHDIARTTARVAVTSDNPAQAAQDFAATQGVSVAVAQDEIRGLVTVEVAKSSRIPLLGRISRIVGLRASATMMRESPAILSR